MGCSTSCYAAAHTGAVPADGGMDAQAVYSAVQQAVHHHITARSALALAEEEEGEEEGRPPPGGEQAGEPPPTAAAAADGDDDASFISHHILSEDDETCSSLSQASHARPRMRRSTLLTFRVRATPLTPKRQSGPAAQPFSYRIASVAYVPEPKASSMLHSTHLKRGSLGFPAMDHVNPPSPVAQEDLPEPEYYI
eukprot:EG_transcript_23588